MTARGQAAWDAAFDDAPGTTTPRAPEAPVFDAVEFDTLSEMIGEDGVREMVVRRRGGQPVNAGFNPLQPSRYPRA